MSTKETTMMNPEAIILKDEKLGNPISEKLSVYLRKYTDKDDRANVATITGVGTSTLRNVVFRSNTLTEDNSKGIIELIRIAIENCENSIDSASEAVADLREILKETA